VIIAMSRPWRHPDTGVFYFRSRLPADLKKVVAGWSLIVDVAGDASTVKLADTVKISIANEVAVWSARATRQGAATPPCCPAFAGQS
jgi:hypothetical protein